MAGCNVNYNFFKGSFVAAFASSNLGDVSPNIMGPRCQYSGTACDYETSKCPGNTEHCVAFGPGNNQFESTKIIAERLYGKALVKMMTRTLLHLHLSLFYKYTIFSLGF